jgi:phosphoglycerate dehydrogenase-like enzyme
MRVGTIPDDDRPTPWDRKAGMSAPRIAVGPYPNTYAENAIRAGGGVPVIVGERAEGLVWLGDRDPDGLNAVMEASPGIRWVQLSSAGVDAYASRNIFDDGRTWTCAKGCYAEPVAEHALLLALAGLRQLHERFRVATWGERAGSSLYDQAVTVLGGGGIATALLGLLAPFRVRATVVRRRPDPVLGASRVVATEQLHDALSGALVVFVVLALTPETTGIISGPELALMDTRAWLVNVARGSHVVTDALVEALECGEIGGAALDVTDPEPLPEGHALWALPNCIVTPHTADTPEMTEPLLAVRIAANVTHLRASEPLEGLIDAEAGY